MTYQVTLPEMGEGVIEGTLARWLVSEGDRVERYAPIAEVETDKVTTETTTETAGTILRLCVDAGETVPVGTVLAIIGEPGEAVDGDQPDAAAAPPPTPPERQPPANGVPQPAVAPQPAAAQSPAPAYTGRISPVVGRIAAEHGVELGRVTGTGRDGRITKDDILAYVAARGETETADGRRRVEATDGALARQGASDDRSRPADNSDLAAVANRPSAVAGQPPAIASPTPATSELLPLTNIRRAIAEHMVRSVQTSPHVTTVFEFDFSAVAAHRRAHVDSFARDGVRLTYMAYIVAATVEGLKANPLVNSSWSDEGLILHRTVNIGMATAIDDGLIVPVIKGADGLNLLGLARVVNDLADRARAKQLKPDEVKGGTFSITNFGSFGCSPGT